jgi:protein involved in polysaccharide export with SLBB domain
LPRLGRRLPLALGLALLVPCLHGCAALTNPVAEGVRVRSVPLELLGQSREEAKPIPLTLLRQKPPDAYRLAPGDILGVWIETILGDRNQPVPVRYSEREGQPPALGFPIPVRDDGTLPLPLIAPVRVEGLTVAEAQEAIRRAYTTPKEILKPGAERIIVTLQRPRQYRVLVVREDAATPPSEQNAVALGIATGPRETIGSTRRGLGAVVSLPAYENDVLTALARTGGLPGRDAKDEVLIERAGAKARDWPDVMPAPDEEACAPPGAGPASGSQVLRIPLRLRPGEPIPFRPEDIVLRDGDIVRVQARDAEVFYTGGILPPGEYILPRDYDLDVVDAVCRVRGPLVSGGINQNNFTGSVVAAGLGFPSPSLLSVIRRTRQGGQLTIRVDLNKALRDPRERILVQPGDVLILQETPGEAIARYISEMVKFNFLGIILKEGNATATATVNVP